MMNLIAISLIATSIVVSGLFSPNPQSNGGKGEQVIVKGGHRAVVVEYGDDVGVGNTKVSISPPQSAKGTGQSPTDEELSRAAASVAGVAQDVKGKAHDVLTSQSGPHEARPRELICDAFGKCKHKIAGVWSKAKEKAADVEETVEEVMDKAKELASKAGHRAEESVEGVRENVKETRRKAGEAAEKVKEKTGEAAERVKEKTGEMAREKMEKTEELVEETGEMIMEKGKKGKKEITDIARRGKEVVMDSIWYVGEIGYVVVKETLGSVFRVSQLLGIATAYGMAVWVTLINSYVLAGVLPRQQFGMVQSKIYPVYFKAMVGSIGLALLGHLLRHRGKMLRNNADMLQGYNLTTSLLFVLGNLLFLEPRATKAMFDRMKLEKEETRGRDRDTPARVIDTMVSETAGFIPTTTPTTPTVTGTTAAPTSTAPVGRSEEDKSKTKLAKLDNRLKNLNSYSSLLNIMTVMGLTWHLVYLSQRLRPNSC